MTVNDVFIERTRVSTIPEFTVAAKSLTVIFGHIFANPVKYHDGIMHAIANYRKHGCDKHGINFHSKRPAEDGKYAQDQEHIMDQGHNRASAPAKRLGHLSECKRNVQ